MKPTRFSIIALRKNNEYILLGIAIFLACVHALLIWKVAFHLDAHLHRNTGSEFLSISLLFWVTALLLVWQKRHKLELHSGVFSKFLGGTIIALVLVKGCLLIHSKNDSFLYLFPLLSMTGLGILASGIKGLKQYWQELLLFVVIAIPLDYILAQLVNLDNLTAQFANFLLSHLGFDSYRNGAVVALPTGAIRVDPGCSGARAITRLLQISALILATIPTSMLGKVIVPIIAALVAFTINSIRVAILALLIANNHKNAFDYWHTGTGSHTISIVSVVVLWLLSQRFIQQDESEEKVSVS